MRTQTGTDIDTRTGSGPENRATAGVETRRHATRAGARSSCAWSSATGVRASPPWTPS